MASKFLLVLGLVLVATLLLISSEVSARELDEETGAKNKEGVDDTKQFGGYGGFPGRGYGGYPGGGYPWRGYGGYPGRGYGGYPWRRPYCRWGCCGGGWYGGCRCCMYPGEVPDASVQTEP